MTTVAVTGSSGYVGSVLLDLLAREPDINRVVGIDLVDPATTTQNLEFYRMDVRSSDLADAFRGVDAVVHLAASSGDDPDEIRDVNISGTRSVADAATRMGVHRLVFASSVRVYGAHPDNDFPLTERSPVRPGRDDIYAKSKAEAEAVVRYYADSHAGTAGAVLRLAWVCGPTIPTRHAAVIDPRVRFVVEGYDPPFQALHEADAARALAFAATRDTAGTFNISADDSVESPEALLHQRRVTLGLERAKRVLPRTARFSLSGPATSLGPLMYPQVMSNDALRAEGFTPEYSTADALREGAEARRDWVAVGNLRFRPRRVVMIGGTVGAMVLGGAARARRVRRASRRSTDLPE